MIGSARLVSLATKKKKEDGQACHDPSSSIDHADSNGLSDVERGLATTLDPPFSRWARRSTTSGPLVRWRPTTKFWFRSQWHTIRIAMTVIAPQLASVRVRVGAMDVTLPRVSRMDSVDCWLRRSIIKRVFRTSHLMSVMWTSKLSSGYWGVQLSQL